MKKFGKKGIALTAIGGVIAALGISALMKKPGYVEVDPSEDNVNDDYIVEDEDNDEETEEE